MFKLCKPFLLTLLFALGNNAAVVTLADTAISNDETPASPPRRGLRADEQMLPSIKSFLGSQQQEGENPFDARSRLLGKQKKMMKTKKKKDKRSKNDSFDSATTTAAASTTAAETTMAATTAPSPFCPADGVEFFFSFFSSGVSFFDANHDYSCVQGEGLDTVNPGLHFRNVTCPAVDTPLLCDRVCCPATHSDGFRYDFASSDALDGLVAQVWITGGPKVLKDVKLDGLSSKCETTDTTSICVDTDVFGQNINTASYEAIFGSV